MPGPQSTLATMTGLLKRKFDQLDEDSVSSDVTLVKVGEHAIKHVYFLEGVCWCHEASAHHEKQLSP